MFDLIIGRIQQENEHITGIVPASSIEIALLSFGDGGYFADIEYIQDRLGNREAAVHLARLHDLVFAYTMPASSYYQSLELYGAIVSGLGFWAYQPDTDHWWTNQIDRPQRLGVLLIQMKKGKRQLPPGLEAKLIDCMIRNRGRPETEAGANKTDIALQWLYRACLTRNGPLLKQAIEYAFETIAISTEEGIRNDLSYFQHGRQLYTIGYGTEFVKGITLFALYAQDTPYALSGEKRDLFSAFVRGTFFPVFRGQYSPFTVGGRSISRPDGTWGGAAALYARRMRVIDPANAAFYDAARQRLSGEQPSDYQIAAQHIHYPEGDYTLHIRPGYMFDVRIVSRRTGRIEYGNNENVKTCFASDGSTTIARRGDEYKAIFPVWNWTRIPGITCAQADSVPLPPNQWFIPGTAVFAGGVSDSLYGVTTYAYNADYTGNSAQKAWFFFDDEVVCLGNSINTNTAAAMFNINTTVNQCLLSGDVIISAGGCVSTLDGGEYTWMQAPDWVMHDGIGYFFPCGGAVGLSNLSRSGKWQDINARFSGDAVTHNVFALWCEHGKQPDNAAYAYIVAPDINTAAEMEAYEKRADVVIAANTGSVQAVYQKRLDMLGLVFYEAQCFLYEGMRLEVDKPCIILLSGLHSDKLVLHITDPAQTETAIKVTLSAPAVSPDVLCISADFSGTGVYAGVSKNFLLNNIFYYKIQ